MTNNTEDRGTLSRIELSAGGRFGVYIVALGSALRRCATVDQARLLANALNGELKAAFDDVTLVAYEAREWIDDRWVAVTEAS